MTRSEHLIDSIELPDRDDRHVTRMPYDNTQGAIDRAHALMQKRDKPDRSDAD